MLAGSLELFVGFELGPTGSDHVEAAGVAVGVDDVGGELHVFVLDQPVRPLQEAEETAFGMQRTDAVEETGDHIVSAGSLSAGENHADVQRSREPAALARFEGEHRAAEGGFEDFANLLDVGDRGGRSAFIHTDQGAFGQRGGKFRGVGGARLLQRRNRAHDFIPLS